MTNLIQKNRMSNYNLKSDKTQQIKSVNNKTIIRYKSLKIKELN